MARAKTNQIMTLAATAKAKVLDLLALAGDEYGITGCFPNISYNTK
jgi:hypothetical protein